MPDPIIPQNLAQSQPAEPTPTAAGGGTPLVLTSEDAARAKKELNKAKRDAKKARRAAEKAAEKAADDADKAARKKRQEELRVTVVDGHVVDQHGNQIRPYTRAEWFFDNKPLVYTILIIAIALMMASLFIFKPVEA